jgi:hypothetical protein
MDVEETTQGVRGKFDLVRWAGEPRELQFVEQRKRRRVAPAFTSLLCRLAFVGRGLRR